MKKRYTRSGHFFTQEFLVKCPKCEKAASVTNKNKYRYGGDKDLISLSCSNCGYQTKLSDLILYRATVKRNCPSCGKMIHSEQDSLKKAPREMSVPCEGCGFRAEYKVNASSYTSLPFLNGLKGDPYFGLSLWFQTEVKGNLLWGYNRQHLEEIREYVESDIRDIRCTPWRTEAMVSRLPAFIKIAKNKNAIIKAIDKMLDK